MSEDLVTKLCKFSLVRWPTIINSIQRGECCMFKRQIKNYFNNFDIAVKVRYE